MKCLIKLLKSFLYAGKGIFNAIQTQRNVRIHINAVVVVVVLGALVNFSAWKWVVLALCCGGVISLELVNTAIELLCDWATKDFHETIGHIKDIAAGAVLIMAIATAAIAAILFASDNAWIVLLDRIRTEPLVRAELICMTLVSAVHVLFFSEPKHKR